MKRKTIMFFPVEPGIAHVTRCLAIGEKLKKRGHRVIFAICKEKQQLPRNAGMEVVTLPVFLRDDFTQEVEKLKDPKLIMDSIDKELQVLKKYKPDAAVVDLRLTAVLSTLISDIPRVFIASSGALPYGCHIPNPGYPGLLHLLLQPFLYRAIWHAKMPYINSLLAAGNSLGYSYTTDDLFDTMTYIIPEVEGYLPAVVKNKNIKYVGPLFWDGFAKDKPPWLPEISPDGRTVYVTFGGTGLDAKKLITLSRLLVARGFRVVVTASTIAQIHDFPKHRQLFVTRYISGWDICRKVDIIVCHGGYGTMMQAILSGKPVVAIPFNPDQILHSLRFQELNIGKAMFQVDFKALLTLDWQRLQKMGSHVPNERVVDAVGDILANYPIYAESIKRFTHGADFSGGSSYAADIIEQILIRDQ